MQRILLNVDVPDLEAAVAFYTAGLGCELLRTLFARSVAELTLGESAIYLIERPAGTRAFPGGHAHRVYERHWTPVHIDVVVDDIETAAAKALAAGARRSGDQTSHPWGRLMPLSDPFGHGLCLLQFSAAGYEAVAD